MSKSHKIRNSILAALLIIGCGVFAGIYLNDRGSREPGPSGIRQRIVESPIFSFLPRWFLDKAAVTVSLERNARVLKSVFEVFDPSLRSFLASVPIILDSSANTAKSYPAKGYIGVSPDWDNTVLRSEYRTIYEQRGMKPGDPVFMDRFKTDLLIHEFLHILQVHLRIDSRTCYEAVARWYKDPQYGIPSPDGLVRTDVASAGRPATLATNRMKYILWHQLYNYRRLNNVPRDETWQVMQYGERYRSADPGVEEFAYIGQEILADGSGSASFVKTGTWSEKDWQSKKMRMREVSPEVLALFKGIFSPQLTH